MVAHKKDRNLTIVNKDKNNLWTIYRSSTSHINYKNLVINGIVQLTCSLNIFFELHEYAMQLACITNKQCT